MSKLVHISFSKTPFIRVLAMKIMDLDEISVDTGF